jgi:hypothetical protein
VLSYKSKRWEVEGNGLVTVGKASRTKAALRPWGASVAPFRSTTLLLIRRRPPAF